MSIENFSDAELLREINRRDEAKEKARIPKAIEIPDFSELIEMCKQYIDEVANDTVHDDDDTREYIYECAIECVFGKKVWDWINKKKG